MAETKILYFDCSSGISGDMTLGALMDLCGESEQERFLKELEKLNLEGYEISFERVVRNAITMNHADVRLTGEACHEHDHHHGHGEHDHDHHHHEDEHHHKHGDHHHHEDEHHHHDHGDHHHHDHDHAHGHFHRSFKDIKKMISESELSDDVKELSLKIFQRVANAEAKVHNKSVDDVQFHEVGAVDSIVDIVGCAILISMIRPDAVYASVVQDGHGFIHCQHGLLSVPVPAVSEIFAASDVVLRQIDVETELVTPTGAAIIAELACSFGTMPDMKIEKIGWGAGTKILKIPNGLKVYQGGMKAEDDSQIFDHDEIMVLQTNLDDCTGEMLGYAMGKLMSAGALDVFYTPVYMKKNRPAWCLTVLAKPEAAERMEREMFIHTTTIGIRKHLEHRTILRREKSNIETENGLLDVKSVDLGTERRNYIEYESAVKLAEKTGRSLWEIYNLYGKSE